MNTTRTDAEPLLRPMTRTQRDAAAAQQALRAARVAFEETYRHTYQRLVDDRRLGPPSSNASAEDIAALVRGIEKALRSAIDVVDEIYLTTGEESQHAVCYPGTRQAGSLDPA